MSNNLIPLITGTNINDFSREELYNICHTLELEYRGGSVNLDTVNIGTLDKSISKPKLKRFALYNNIVSYIIDKENTTYVNPPIRSFTTKSGAPVSKRLGTYINSLYDQMKFDLFAAKAEKFSALLGTVLYRPAYDQEDDTMNIIEMYPSNDSLQLFGSAMVPGKIVQLKYEYSIGDTDFYVTVDKYTIITRWEDENGKEFKDVDDHNFGVLPFGILNFKLDNTRAYGPPDYELFSLCKHRSLILSNVTARMHLSALEKLLIMGVDKETAMKNITSNMLTLPSTTDAQGNIIQPTAQYISPDGQDALNLLEAYFKLYNHIMDNRGHVQKIFSRGADVPSAESIRLGSVDLYNKQQEKKKFLTLFEKEMFARIVLENNRHSSTMIPETTEIAINFKPEPYSFANGSDEVTYFTSAIKQNVETPISWIRNRSPELSEEEAIELYESNKEFMEADREKDEPVVDNEDDDIKDDDKDIDDENVNEDDN